MTIYSREIKWEQYLFALNCVHNFSHIFVSYWRSNLIIELDLLSTISVFMMHIIQYKLSILMHLVLWIDKAVICYNDVMSVLYLLHYLFSFHVVVIEKLLVTKFTTVTSDIHACHARIDWFLWSTEAVVPDLRGSSPGCLCIRAKATKFIYTD